MTNKQASVDKLIEYLIEESDKNITINNIPTIKDTFEAGWHGYRVAYLDTAYITDNNNLSNEEKIKQLLTVQQNIDNDVKSYHNYELLSDNDLQEAWLNNYKQYIDDTIAKLKLQGKYFIEILADYSDEFGDIEHKSMLPVITNGKIVDSSNSTNIQFYDDEQTATKIANGISEKDLRDGIEKYIPGNEYSELLNYDIIVREHNGVEEHRI